MHDITIRAQAVSLSRSGRRNTEIAQLLGIRPGTIAYWVHLDRAKHDELPGRERSRCFRCLDTPPPSVSYSYLLGLYLGDGHIVQHPRAYSLSISCCDSWPGLIEAAAHAMDTTMPGRGKCNRVPRQGCTDVKGYSQHWLCLFPQHGPGRKHNRPILLESWQQEIVDGRPWEFVRGLIHSDGCRHINWTTRQIRGETRRYEYTRYEFGNESADIMRLLTTTLDTLGVEWRFNRRNSVSVAKRRSVELMDAHIGPKY